MPRSRPRRDLSLVSCAVVLAIAAALGVGCGGTVGPLVTNVEFGKDGELIVTRCLLDIDGSGEMTTYDLSRCKRTVSPPPHAASSERVTTDAEPPADASTTVVH